MPMDWARVCRAMAVRGACSEGFVREGQPAARAGAALRASMARGKFQGVMKEETPTGEFITESLPRRWPGVVEEAKGVGMRD